MHLRPPSLDHGLVSGIWAIVFGLFLFVGAVAVGVQTGTALIVAAVAAGAIYLYVRIYGEEQLRR